MNSILGNIGGLAAAIILFTLVLVGIISVFRHASNVNKRRIRENYRIPRRSSGNGRKF